MVRIIAFEGIDYSGKTTTVNQLASEFSGELGYCFNNGLIFPNDLSSQLSSIARTSNSEEGEFLYTFAHILDSVSNLSNLENEKTFFRDRYWPSVIAYGRFLNKESSFNLAHDLRPLLLPPTTTILLDCSYDELLKRSESRRKRSQIDKMILKDSEEYERLENEIRLSVEGLPNLLRVDTTRKTPEEVSLAVKNHLYDVGVLR
jgi:thymidylate kinase